MGGKILLEIHSSAQKMFAALQKPSEDQIKRSYRSNCGPCWLVLNVYTKAKRVETGVVGISKFSKLFQVIDSEKANFRDAGWSNKDVEENCVREARICFCEILSVFIYVNNQYPDRKKSSVKLKFEDKQFISEAMYFWIFELFILSWLLLNERL